VEPPSESQTPAPPPTDPNQGKILAGSYRIVRLLGEGGMGKVYEAAHVRLTKKRYAVKVLHAGAADNAEVYARFRREAEIATEIGHPHIVEVHDFNASEEGQPFIVMELLTGHDLGGLLGQKGGRLSRQELIPILAQVASGLGAAHERGVVHRDLKPENIYLTRDAEGSVQVKLLDFGLSTIKHQRSRLTQGGAIMGTPDYMAPEQAKGEITDVDQRTDIFALGVIVYQCLSGRLPFDAPTPLGVLYKVVNEQPRLLAEEIPGLSAETDAIIGRAMAKSREDRYGSVEAFIQDLTQVLERPARMASPQEPDTHPVPRVSPPASGRPTGPLPSPRSASVHAAVAGTLSSDDRRAPTQPERGSAQGPRDDDELEETPSVPVAPLTGLPPGAPPLPKEAIEPISEDTPVREPPKVMVSRSLAPGTLVLDEKQREALDPRAREDATSPITKSQPLTVGTYLHDQDTVEKLRGSARWTRIVLVVVILLLLGGAALWITISW
jgi:serine/threonine-protein kinase